MPDYDKMIKIHHRELWEESQEEEGDEEGGKEGECEYCAIFNGLNKAKELLTENEGKEVMNMDMETQIKEALARGYCSPENEHKILDPVLIEAMTRELLQSFTPVKTDKVDSGV